MISEQSLNSCNLKEDSKLSQFAQVYSDILKKYERQTTKIQQIYSNLAFDDTLLTRPNKIWPKIAPLQSQKKVRLKYFSKKLVINDSECEETKEDTTPKPTISYTIQNDKHEKSILVSRHRRIMDLYRRADKQIEIRERQSNKKGFTHVKEGTEKQKQKQISSMQAELSLSPARNQIKSVEDKERKVLQYLKQTRERLNKFELPAVKTRRSNSNILLKLQDYNPEEYVKHSLTFRHVDESDESQKQKQIIKTYRKVKLQQKREITGPTILRRKSNWKNEPLPISKIEREQFYQLMRHYLQIDQVAPIPIGFYKAYVGNGNNCALVKKLLKDRGYWIIVQSMDQQTNFVWTQQKSVKFTNFLIPSEKIKQILVPRNYNQSEVTLMEDASTIEFIKQKKNEYIVSCEKLFVRKQYLALMRQLKQKLKYNSNLNNFLKLKQVYIEYLSQYKKIQKNLEPHTQDSQIKEPINKQIKAIDIKLHNHIDNSGSIGDKKGLLFMMNKYCQIFDDELSNYVPRTVHVEDGDSYEAIFAEMPNGPWILKPGESTNRGNGITVHINRDSLIGELSKKKKHKNGNKFTNIVQQYIEPLLYHGRKFDIRIWVLWSGRRLWWYRQGYLRTSSKEFTLKNMNKFIHLTNDAIQSQGEDFGKHQQANKLSFNEFQKYLEAEYNYRGFYIEMLQKMKEMAVKAFRMGNLTFNQQNRKYCFELFGLDFLIGNDFKPWLIQCNTNPCLEINCSLLSRLVPNMMQNVLNLTIDAYFPPPLRKKQKQSTQWNHQTFKFQLLYDGNNDVQIQDKMRQKHIEVISNFQLEQATLQQQQKQLQS